MMASDLPSPIGSPSSPSTPQLLNITGMRIRTTSTSASTASDLFVIVMDPSPTSTSTNTLYHLRQKIATRLQVPEPDVNLFRVDEPLSIMDDRCKPHQLIKDLKAIRRDRQVDDMMWGRKATVKVSVDEDDEEEDEELTLLPADVTRLFACTWILDLFVPVTEYLGDTGMPFGMLKVLVTIGKQHMPGRKMTRGMMTRKKILSLQQGDFRDLEELRQIETAAEVPVDVSTYKDSASTLYSETSIPSQSTPSIRPVPPRRLPPSAGGSLNGDGPSTSSPPATLNGYQAQPQQAYPSPVTVNSAVKGPPDDYFRGASLDSIVNPYGYTPNLPWTPPVKTNTTDLRRNFTQAHRPSIRRMHSHDRLSLDGGSSPQPIYDTDSLSTIPPSSTRVIHLPGLVLGKDPTTSTFIMIVEENASMPSLLFRIADRIGHPRRLVHQICLFAPSTSSIAPSISPSSSSSSQTSSRISWNIKKKKPIYEPYLPPPITIEGLDLFDQRLQPASLLRSLSTLSPSLTLTPTGHVAQTGHPVLPSSTIMTHTPQRFSASAILSSSFSPQRRHGARRNLLTALPASQSFTSVIPSEIPRIPTITDVIPVMFPGMIAVPPSLAVDPSVPVSAFFPRVRRAEGVEWVPTSLRILVVVDPERREVDSGGGVELILTPPTLEGAGLRAGV
ncbi:hypothetical protein BC829DRAFT_82747 [Chytridium lagenaria]|nr:hypothetical protein BC829DRAFT_82747 [Chytridium lagenaria]